MSDSLDKAAHQLIRLAFAEDLPDETSDAIFDPKDRLEASLVAREAGVICGLRFLPMVFSELGRQVRFHDLRLDGDAVEAGAILGRLTGPTRTILAAERTFLNLMQHLSGIATLTARFVEKTAGTKCRVLDTRKTRPGYRLLDKYAVRTGGGVNHRLGLWDAIMIKDNHVDRAGGIGPAIEQVLQARRRKKKRLPIIVETRDLAEVRAAAEYPIDRILLDNMSLRRMRRAVAILDGRVATEASGGIRLARVARVAATGVDFVSVGEITHSARALDIALDVVIPEGA